MPGDKFLVVGFNLKVTTIGSNKLLDATKKNKLLIQH